MPKRLAVDVTPGNTHSGVTSLTVWRFDSPRGAEAALPQLERLAADGRISVHDAALVSWPQASRKPSTRTLGGLGEPGALWGGSWGVLLGVIFLLPTAGPSLGAAAGAVAGSLADFGISDDFIKRVRDAVTPGTSALFALAATAAPDAVTAEIGGAEVVRCELSAEQEQRLRAALGEDSERPIA